MIVLVCLLMLTRGAVQLGLARLGVSHDAEQAAFQDATANSPPQYAESGATPGFSTIRPGMPVRLHRVQSEQDVTIYTGDKQPLPPFRVGAMAAVPGPAWVFSGYPAAGDRDLNQQWFESYASESHSELISPLGLAPAWQP